MANHPVLPLRDLIDEVTTNAEQILQLIGLASFEIAIRDQVYGHNLDAEFITPFEKLHHFCRAHAVPERDLVVLPACPPPVAVNDNGNVMGQNRRRQLTLQPSLIKPVQQWSACAIILCHSPNLPTSGSLVRLLG